MQVRHLHKNSISVKYIDETPESGMDFHLNFHQKGQVVMLNLLKYESKADYSNLGILIRT
ncbi:hypothetical protein C1H87_20340 [Flavivirga eckloniae]|uniref:Uncharacterized protein n=1 Tax=Flavivirga eckloniae TaxID=1803846 RepID=A0A2K9PV35_9FLAO|nr:hypothetical protein C1H87_20340 [Flavivirga eckloniae]